MTLENLQKQLTASMKAGDGVRTETLRFLISAIRNAGIAKYGNAWETSLNPADVLDIVKKQIKTHKESVDAFTKAGRSELSAKEQAELAVLEEFAPKDMTDEQLKSLLAPVAASGEQNFGLLMKQAMAAVKGLPAQSGQADGGRVSAILRTMMAK